MRDGNCYICCGWKLGNAKTLAGVVVIDKG